MICAQIEQEIAELDDDEKKEFLEEMGLQESGLEKMIAASYSLLGLISYLRWSVMIIWWSRAAIMQRKKRVWFAQREKNMWCRMEMWCCSALMFRRRRWIYDFPIWGLNWHT